MVEVSGERILNIKVLEREIANSGFEELYSRVISTFIDEVVILKS